MAATSAASLGLCGASCTKLLSILSSWIGRFFQVRQARVAGAKVIDGKAQPQARQRGHAFDHALHIVQHHAFGELQHQVAGLRLAALQQLLQPLAKIALLELARADVDRKR